MNGVQSIGTAVRVHQRIDYTTSLVTKQLYQQDIYQASNASRTLEAGVSGTWGGIIVTVPASTRVQIVPR